MKKENGVEAQPKKKNLKKIIIPIAAVLLVFIILANIWNAYVSNYYHAWDEATETTACNIEGVTVTENEDESITFAPENPTAGIIFYPGAKVEYTAYCPLMSELAQLGYLCVVMKMTQNIALLDVNAADGVQEMYPEVEHWYMAGHSLGGSCAAMYLKKHLDSFDGLILLASYSLSDLSDTDLQVLSIYGSEDGVLNRDNYEKYKEKNLPGMQSGAAEPGQTVGSTKEFVIDGGCHAYFGMYGAQKGDGTPTITNKEQIETTADQINAWITDMQE